MIRELILFAIAATPLRRYCAHERCGCGEYVHVQRDILRHIERVASVSKLLEAGRWYLVDHIDSLQRTIQSAGGTR